MKKIRNSKMYNTDTAEYICGDQNTIDINDFNFLKRDLYRKKNGEFFIVIETYNERSIVTFAKTSYKQNLAHLIENLTPHQFAEKCLTGEDYIKFFGFIDE